VYPLVRNPDSRIADVAAFIRWPRDACRRDVHNESGEAHTWPVHGIAATGERGVPNHPTITIIIEAIVGTTRTAVTDGSGGCTLRTTAHNAIAHNAVVRR
jgi:hypothetical protein